MPSKTTIQKLATHQADGTTKKTKPKSNQTETHE
jgi:hypothetical protein